MERSGVLGKMRHICRTNISSIHTLPQTYISESRPHRGPNLAAIAWSFSKDGEGVEGWVDAPVGVSVKCVGCVWTSK